MCRLEVGDAFPLVGCQTARARCSIDVRHHSSEDDDAYGHGQAQRHSNSDPLVGSSDACIYAWIKHGGSSVGAKGGEKKRWWSQRNAHARAPPHAHHARPLACATCQ